MRSKTLIGILSAEALACIAFCVLGKSFEDSFTSVMAFPFEQIGMGLRILSLSGSAGNAAAIGIYGCLCLLPSLYLARRVLRGKATPEDTLLLLLSAVLFAVLYMMVNPTDIAKHFGSDQLVPVGKAFLGVTAHTVVVGYVILHAMRRIARSGTESMLRFLKIFMTVICIILIYCIFGSGLIGLSDSFRQLTQENTDRGQALYYSYIFLILQYLVDVLPYTLDILILFSGFAFVRALEKDPYGEDVAPSARKTGYLCRVAVICMMLSQIAVNTLQLVLGSLVRSSHYTLSIPLVSVVFALVAMLLSNYFEQARKIKDDNDMII